MNQCPDGKDPLNLKPADIEFYIKYGRHNTIVNLCLIGACTVLLIVIMWVTYNVLKIV